MSWNQAASGFGRVLGERASSARKLLRLQRTPKGRFCSDIYFSEARWWHPRAILTPMHLSGLAVSRTDMEKVVNLSVLDFVKCPNGLISIFKPLGKQWRLRGFMTEPRLQVRDSGLNPASTSYSS